TEPEAVFRVHQAYIEAGAHIIETNTFGANRFKLAPLGLAEEVQRLNSRGVKIAREARESASREVLIAGSIGPLGLGVQSRHPSAEEIQDIFHEQALALEERGVDFYILETFSYIEELLLAIDAIRSFSGLPIVAQLSYAEEGTTYGDVRPADAAAQLKNKNVQVIGANCTLGPQALLPILEELAAVDGLRVSGMPIASRKASFGENFKPGSLLCALRSVRQTAFRSIASSSRWIRLWPRRKWMPSTSTAEPWPALAWTP